MPGPHMIKKRKLSDSRFDMTLPDERYRAVMWASKFLQEIAYDTKKYPRVPLIVRQEAKTILRHYPSSWDLDQAERGAPDVFQKRMEPVYRMVKAYEQDKQNES